MRNHGAATTALRALLAQGNVLGVVTDQEIADRVGCTRALVQHFRKVHGIPRRIATRTLVASDPGLGVDADRTVAERLGVSMSAVTDARRAAGLPPTRKWAHAPVRHALAALREAALDLGEFTIKELAAATGRTPAKLGPVMARYVAEGHFVEIGRRAGATRPPGTRGGSRAQVVYVPAEVPPVIVPMAEVPLDVVEGAPSDYGATRSLPGVAYRRVWAERRRAGLPAKGRGGRPRKEKSAQG